MPHRLTRVLPALISLALCWNGALSAQGLPWSEAVQVRTAPKSSLRLDSLVVRVRSDSNDALLRYELAMAYWAANRFDDADRELREAVAIAPQYAEAYLARSALPIARGEKYWRKVEKEQGSAAVEAGFEAAAAAFRRAIMLNPLLDLAILGRLEERTECRRSYGRRGCLVIKPWWAPGLIQGINAFRSSSYQEAFAVLDSLLGSENAGDHGRQLPESVLWHHGLAAAHLKRLDEAIQDFAVLTGRAYADESADPLTATPLKTNDYRYTLATLLYLAGRHGEAMPTFRRALEFDVSLYPAHVQLARMLEAEQRWDEAIVERQAATLANPDDSVLLVDLARTLLRAGRAQEASDALAQAMSVNPRDASSPYLAGIVALRLDQRDAARRAFERFLAVAPSRLAPQITEVRGQLSTLVTQ